MKISAVDPITAEILGNAFLSITEQMGASLIRSAYSTNIKERRDCSCALFSADGSLIALAEHIPIHLGSMQGLVTQISQDQSTWNLKNGDILIANDPYLGGGSHLPDMTLIKPFFYRGRLSAFLANIAHWADIGGRSPGAGTAGGSTEIYQEGLRIPSVKLYKNNSIQKDLLTFLLSNMRCPEERMGDLRAQVASLQLGERQLTELFERYNQTTLNASVQENLDYSERLLRNALKSIPEGIYCFQDWMDDDGIHSKPLVIKVKISVSHGNKPKIEFDFLGTAQQTEGGINMVWAALLATVSYALKAVVGPNIPLNSGFQRPIRILAPLGCLVNAQEPAAVGGRTDTCQRVVDTIFGALAQAVPKKITAASNGATTALIFGGTKSLTGQDFVYVEALGGGMGASSKKDGMDGIQVHITNTSNLPVESMELEYPLRVLRYGLVPDSGGPGRRRGGLAIRKEIMALKPMRFSAHSDRHKIPPWGFQGGYPGSKGHFLLERHNRTKKYLRSKVVDIVIHKNDILKIQTAGGGGYGPPEKREPEKVVNDLHRGRISCNRAKKIYKVIWKKNGLPDPETLTSLRSSPSKE